MIDTDTIVAQASPPGRGGVSIVRLSGPKSKEIAAQLFKKELSFFSERKHAFVNCYKAISSEKHNAQIIDEGLCLYFKAPHSFTGEDVIEFQCHGNPIIVDQVISSSLDLGARLANPGEFSERAFLNGKIDLVQAEAIADLIDSQSTQAAKNALQTLKGAFSKTINTFNDALIELRMYLEASIDFPDEEGVDFIIEGKIQEKTQKLLEQLTLVRAEAEQGQILQEGLNVVLAGEPNAGKSSLLNCLSRKDSAIVTNIAGTTRDILKEKISINGLALNIIDTAGLRESSDIVEQEGIKRAWQEIEEADLILYLVDSLKVDKLTQQSAWQSLQKKLLSSSGKETNKKIIIVENKIDLSEVKAAEGTIELANSTLTKVAISAKENQGIDILKNKITSLAGLNTNQESKYTARRRHIEALNKALSFLNQAIQHFHQKGDETSMAGELLAEDLRLAHKSLGEITGEFSSDDLLGEIFSGFCIGK